MRTGDIALSDNLAALTELIEANIHDVWETGRIIEDCSYRDVKEYKKHTLPYPARCIARIKKGIQA